MALVIDEYGILAGLVAIKFLEEIVGEIEDEHDTQEILKLEKFLKIITWSRH